MERGESDLKRCTEKLLRQFESLEVPGRKHMLQILEEISFMNPDLLAKTCEYVIGQKPLPLPAQQKTCLSNVLVLSGGSANMLEDSLNDEDDEENIFDEEANKIWDAARYSDIVRPDCCEIGESVRREEFWEKIETFAQVMETGGLYLFYYAGHGTEIDASFHFIPKGARAERDCIAIGDIMKYIDKVANVRCQVIFCINACRGKTKKPSDMRDPLDNECGRANKYFILFSTSSGENVPLVEDISNVFAQVVVEKMLCFTCDNVIQILNDICETIQKRDEQQNPWLFCGGLRDLSSRASSGSNFSFPTPANWTDRLQGYTLMKANVSSSFRESPKSSKFQIKDTRKDQRRRLNRFTAPTFDPACVIIGHTSGKSKDERIQRFQEQGMGPNYVIAEDGSCYLLVEPNLMAWEYNLAYWGGSCGVIEGEGTMPSKGPINELKTYAISIALEGNGRRDYTEEQYEALEGLMQDLKKNWRIDAWNVLSAAEVVQPPQKEEDAEPGPRFEWQRLANIGLCLDAKEESLQPCGLFDEAELRRKMKEWGYAFGTDTEDHFRRRLSAFRHRYLRHQDLGGATFSGYDTAAVESLLQQREKLRASQ